MPDRIIVKQADDGSFYWVRRAPNGEDVAQSETYTRRADAKEAAEREAQAQGAEVSE